MARGGRYWNVGFSDRSKAGATDRQLRYLRSLYARDFRGEGLTQGKAAEMIEEGLELRSKERNGISDIADQLFTHLIKRATEAANEAGKLWLLKNPRPKFTIKSLDQHIPVHGIVGIAYITAPKKGSGLANWMNKHGFNDLRNKKELVIHHRYTEKMEAELHLACCDAALSVLRESTSETGDLRIIFKCDREDFKIAS